MAEDKLTRIGIIDADKCKSKKCSHECIKICPIMRSGKQCFTINKETNIVNLSEDLCIGCGMCVKKCPFKAINILNIPKSLDSQCVHRYGQNSFKLHRLPVPKQGKVLGLVGSNGIGKSTALHILSGKMMPNLGRYDDPPSWRDVINYFRGSELQNYFIKIMENKLKVVTKLQYIDNIPRAITGTVGSILKSHDERHNIESLIDMLELKNILNRNISEISGGELQRFAIATICSREADVYMFDEPSSYLDVKQRLTVANIIRSLLSDDKYVIVVEHDLSVLDYLSDYICCLYGDPGMYGVVTAPYNVGEGINIFLNGFVPTENLRFRETSLDFKIATDDDIITTRHNRITYPHLIKTLSDTNTTFNFSVSEGYFSESEIIVLLGKNGTGKTTFIRMLAGLLEPDNTKIPTFNFNYKPQIIKPTYKGTVRQLLHTKIGSVFFDPTFQTNVIKPLCLDSIYEQQVMNLSGGELQRVAIILCLGKPADIYLIDEPSAYLDSEQRIVVSKVIKRFIMHTKKTAFIVEHDFIMSSYLADKIIYFDGIPSQKCHASEPMSITHGINTFLKDIEITFRRDPTNFRPRINKLNSVKDKEQKEIGDYFSNN